jgi:hypothetical protein
MKFVHPNKKDTLQEFSNVMKNTIFISYPSQSKTRTIHGFNFGKLIVKG